MEKRTNQSKFGRALPIRYSHLALTALFVGVLLRVLWALLIPVVPVSDSNLYNEFARSLAAGNGFAYPDGSLTAYWPVGTSAVYAALYSLFGGELAVVAVFNIIVGGLIILLTYLLAERAFGGRAAIVAAWIVACWPVLIQFTTVLASELPFTALVLGALYVWGCHGLGIVVRTVTWASLIAAAIYVRPTAMPLLVMLPAMQVLRDREWRGSLLSVVIAGIIAAVFLAPWMARNEALWGKARVMVTNFGPNLWMGNNPDSTGGYMPLPERTFLNEVHRDTALRAEALAFIRGNPARYLQLSAHRLVDTFERETIGVAWNEPGLLTKFGPSVLMPLKLLATVYWWLVLGLGTAGGILLIARQRLSVFDPIVAVPLLFTAVAVFVVSQDRYHLPIDPFLAILAGALLTQRRDQRDSSKASKT